MLIVTIIENNTIFSAQELKSPPLAKVIPTSLTSSTFSVHSSTNLSTSFFLRLQFSLSKYYQYYCILI